jgi:hypothetical protein
METAERARSSSSSGRTIVIVIAVVVALLASPYVFVGGWMGWETAKELASRRRFDQEAWWRAGYAATGAEPVRLRMVDDLLQRRLLDGKTRAEVIALLGPPPETAYFREYDLVYWLGPERSIFSIDSEWLGIRLGPDGRVAEAVLLRD